MIDQRELAKYRVVYWASDQPRLPKVTTVLAASPETARAATAAQDPAYLHTAKTPRKVRTFRIMGR